MPSGAAPLAQPFPPATKLLTASQRTAIYAENPAIREARNMTDDLIEDTNDAMALFQSSKVAAANKALVTCAGTATKLLKRLEQYRPSEYSPPTPLQQTVMVIFVDAATCLANVLLSTAQLREMEDSPREAIVLYQSAMPQCEAVEDKESAFTCRVGIGNCYRAMGEIEKSINLLTNEYAGAVFEKDEIGIAICANSLSKSYLDLPFSSSDDNAHKALEYAKVDLEISERLDDEAQLGSANIQIAACASAGDDWETAVKHYATGIQLCEAAGDTPVQLLATLECAWMVLCKGGMENWGDEALSLGKKAMGLAKVCGDKQSETLATAVCVNSNTSEEGAMRSRLEALLQTKTTTCGVCDKELDYTATSPEGRVHTAIRTCLHSTHEACFMHWVAQDKLVCPCEGCEKPLMSWVKSEPKAVLRIAQGDKRALNFF